MKTVLLTLALLAVALLAMAFKVLLVRGGRFPSGHAHDIARLSSQKQKKQNHSKPPKP